MDEWRLDRETLKIIADRSGTNSLTSWEGQCKPIDEDFHSFAIRMSEKYEQENLELEQRLERAKQEGLKKNQI